MKRRNFLQNMAVASAAIAGTGYADVANALALTTSNENKLTAPKTGKILVAFLVSRGATMIDYAGPWEVFQDVHIPSRGSDHADQMPYELFTVSDTTETVVGSAGLKIVPNYNFANAPSPKVVVIPEQGGRSQSMFEWLAKVSQTADVVMSVCTGAFILARAGMLNGKSATT